MNLTDMLEYADWLIRFAAALVLVVSGATILERRRDAAGKLMGAAALALFVGALGDLLPRVLGAGALGSSAGQMLWTLALTVFCVLMTLIWEKVCDAKMGFYAEMLTRHSSGIRALGCIAPFVFRLAQVIQGESPEPALGLPEGLIAPGVRCLGLAVAAAVGVSRWHKTRDKVPALRSVWLWYLGAAVFEIAAELGAVCIPALGSLRLAALACLAALMLRFVRYAGERSGEIE